MSTPTNEGWEANGPQDAAPPTASPSTDPTATADRPAVLSCLLCEGTTFRSETIRAEGEQGYSRHYLDLKICTSCSYTYPFYRESAW